MKKILTTGFVSLAMLAGAQTGTKTKDLPTATDLTSAYIIIDQLNVTKKAPASLFTVFGSQTANYFYAAPNGSSGLPTFRAMVANDVPTLNQNTTGSAGSVLNALSIGAELISGGASSYNGSVAKTLGIQSGAVTNGMLANNAITIAGNSTALGSSVTQDNITGLSSTGLVKRTGANTLAVATSGTDYAPATSGSSILKASSGGFANVIGSDLNSTYGSQTANFVYAAPNGSSGNPSFRAAFIADLSNLGSGWAAAMAATYSSGALSGLTTGRIPFASSSTTLADDGSLTWDNTNKVMNITAKNASLAGPLLVTNFSGGTVFSVTAGTTAANDYSIFTGGGARTIKVQGGSVLQIVCTLGNESSTQENFLIKATTGDGSGKTNGDHLALQGGDGSGTANGLGGDVVLTGGTGVGQAGGNIKLMAGTGSSSGNIGINGASFGSGNLVIFIANASSVPSTNPSGGGILYVDAGALKYRGSSGTVTTVGIP